LKVLGITAAEYTARFCHPVHTWLEHRLGHHFGLGPNGAMPDLNTSLGKY
jgi:hypothetical protein